MSRKTNTQPQTSYAGYVEIINAYVALRVAYLKAGTAARLRFKRKFPRIFPEEKLP